MGIDVKCLGPIAAMDRVLQAIRYIEGKAGSIRQLLCRHFFSWVCKGRATQYFFHPGLLFLSRFIPVIKGSLIKLRSFFDILL